MTATTNIDHRQYINGNDRTDIVIHAATNVDVDDNVMAIAVVQK